MLKRGELRRRAVQLLALAAVGCSAPQAGPSESAASNPAANIPVKDGSLHVTIAIPGAERRQILELQWGASIVRVACPQPHEPTTYAYHGDAILGCDPEQNIHLILGPMERAVLDLYWAPSRSVEYRSVEFYARQLATVLVDGSPYSIIVRRVAGSEEIAAIVETTEGLLAAHPVVRPGYRGICPPYAACVGRTSPLLRPALCPVLPGTNLAQCAVEGAGEDTPPAPHPDRGACLQNAFEHRDFYRSNLCGAFGWVVVQLPDVDDLAVAGVEASTDAMPETLIPCDGALHTVRGGFAICTERLLARWVTDPDARSMLLRALDPRRDESATPEALGFGTYAMVDTAGRRSEGQVTFPLSGAPRHLPPSTRPLELFARPIVSGEPWSNPPCDPAVDAQPRDMSRCHLIARGVIDLEHLGLSRSARVGVEPLTHVPPDSTIPCDGRWHAKRNLRLRCDRASLEVHVIDRAASALAIAVEQVWQRDVVETLDVSGSLDALLSDVSTLTIVDGESRSFELATQLSSGPPYTLIFERP